MTPAPPRPRGRACWDRARRSLRREDRGAGSVLVLALAALGGAVALALAALAAALAAVRGAEAAADLAALAAVPGLPAAGPAGAPDCARAAAVATAQGAWVRSCTAAGDGSVVLEVAVPLRLRPGWLAGLVPPQAVGRARAGPAPIPP